MSRRLHVGSRNVGKSGGVTGKAQTQAVVPGLGFCTE
jgi:hypothetical protein